MHTFCYIDMPGVTVSYGMPFDFIALFLGIFIHFVLLTIYMSELLYLHQTFTDCVPNQY